MYGLVLEGGGTRGAYEIGVYRALQDNKIDIQAITGTSIGAINGAILIQGDLELAVDIWENLSPSTIMDIDDEDFEKLYSLSFNRSEIPQAVGKLRGIIQDGGIDVSPLRDKLLTYIDEDKIRRSGRDFGLVTYNYTRKTPVEVFIEDIPQGQLVDYLLASSALPAFKSHEINGDTYVDGAFHDNLPFSMLEKKGYDKLILVRIHGMGKIHSYDPDKYMVIEPRESLGSVMEIDRQKIAYNMDLGYYDCLRQLKGYWGKSYYLARPYGEGEALDFFLDLGEEKIAQLGQVLGLDQQKSASKFLLEDLLPRLDGLAGLKSSSYLELLSFFLEEKAGQLGLERFRVYDFQELLDLALEENRGLELVGEKKLLATIKKKVFNKEDLIRTCANIIISH